MKHSAFSKPSQPLPAVPHVPHGPQPVERAPRARRENRSRARWWPGLLQVALLGGGSGCGSGGASAPPAAPEAPLAPETASAVAEPAPDARKPDSARGGRLFDNWRAEKKLGKSFVPDSSKTPELDGQGGPNGNGTLTAASGAPVPNTGHDYRLKNFFGWDLRGAAGIYGRELQNKSYVLPHDLLSDTRSAEELRAWLTTGDEQLPGFGQVLDATDIEDLAAYLLETRQGQLARPDHLFRLEASVPKSYVLLPGGDAARGRTRYAETCAACHGSDGREIPIDETESVGSLSRTSGYEVWFKIVSGQPGTDMGRQVDAASGPEQERAVLDLLAALCDRRAFPPLESEHDVPDGDLRCGAYLE